MATPIRGWRDTALTRMFEMTTPVMLGAFGGASSVELTATVSEGGGLGSYGLYGYDAERIERTVRELRSRTSAPFALNLWLPRGDEVPHLDEHAVAADAAGMTELFERAGIPLPARAPDPLLVDVDEQLDAVINARPAVLSVVFGVPSPALLDRARAAGIRVVGTATTVDEAVRLDEAGVDAVVASGSDAGGHRVSFARPAESSLIGTLSLVPQVVDAVRAPVIAAGGIADGRGLAAVLCLGAAAGMVGTAFLATRQSAVAASYREILGTPRSRDTVLTEVMSGRLARGIPNIAMTALEAARDAGGPTAVFPGRNWLTGLFRAEAAARDDAELLSLWAGQAAALGSHRDAPQLLAALDSEADALLSR